MLTVKKIKEYLPEIKKELKIKSRYTPVRYFKGLKTRAQMKQRVKTIDRYIKESKKRPDSIKFVKPFKTDKGVKTKKSSWTKQFYQKYGQKMKELKKKYPKWNHFKRVAKATGMRQSILKEAYDRGMAAYKTGHRPGATAEQWGYARMYSLIIRYRRTTLTHDKDLASKLKKIMKNFKIV